MYVPYRMPGVLPPVPPDPLPDPKPKRTKVIIDTGGFSLGSLLAVLCSWSVNHSVLWAIIHFCFSWAYVLYWVVFT